MAKSTPEGCRYYKPVEQPTPTHGRRSPNASLAGGMHTNWPDGQSPIRPPGHGGPLCRCDSPGHAYPDSCANRDRFSEPNSNCPSAHCNSHPGCHVTPTPTLRPGQERFPPPPPPTPTPTPSIAATPTPGSSIELVDLSVVTDWAATGNFHNAWGGHQHRMVRTSVGVVYSSYLVEAEGDSPNSRAFRVARQSETGWEEIGGDAVFGEPVHLLNGADDTLYVIGWVAVGKVAMWTLAPGAGEFVRTEVPGTFHPGDPLYSAVGISAEGSLYLLASDGGSGDERGTWGVLQWSRYTTDDGWSGINETFMDYRYAYAYLLPEGDRRLEVVGNRDVPWPLLSDDPRINPESYAFNSIGYWRSRSPSRTARGNDCSRRGTDRRLPGAASVQQLQR